MAGTAPPATTVQGLNCPSCGAALTLRASGHTLSVVCPQCLSILDAKDPNLQVLQQFEAKERYQPLIPLGTRGKWRGDLYELIGFQVRAVEDVDAVYSWHEYLLFNPYKGFRYLTQYDGHWNDVKTVKAVPEATSVGGKAAVKLLGQIYTHFQTASARTIYVMGEFPWQAHVGELVMASDFIAPPQILSSESSEEETVWSLGEYTEGARVWEAFQLPGKPPPAVGVFANQPSPMKGRLKEIWAYCGALLLVLLNVALFFSNYSKNEEVYTNHYSFVQGQSEPSFVTPNFELKGRTSTVEIAVHTNLSNDWAYFNFALINEETGQAYDFGREITNYHGELTDSPDDRAVIPSVPAGRYYLRIEPEMSPGGGPFRQPLRYELTVRRDVPSNSLYWLAGLLLLIPPVFLSFRAISFEKARWLEGGNLVSTVIESATEDDQ
jgi:hypothetical protein